jgi:hypothetical protein
MTLSPHFIIHHYYEKINTYGQKWRHPIWDAASKEINYQVIAGLPLAS